MCPRLQDFALPALAGGSQDCRDFQFGPNDHGKRRHNDFSGAKSTISASKRFRRFKGISSDPASVGATTGQLQVVQASPCSPPTPCRWEPRLVSYDAPLPSGIPRTPQRELGQNTAAVPCGERDVVQFRNPNATVSKVQMNGVRDHERHFLAGQSWLPPTRGRWRAGNDACADG